LPFVYDGWFGLMAPPACRARSSQDQQGRGAHAGNAEAKAKLAAQFVLPVTDTPEAFDKIIRDETANLTQVFKEAGIGN